jgi:hypothetical protein
MRRVREVEDWRVWLLQVRVLWFWITVARADGHAADNAGGPTIALLADLARRVER